MSILAAFMRTNDFIKLQNTDELASCLSKIVFLNLRLIIWFTSILVFLVYLTYFLAIAVGRVILARRNIHQHRASAWCGCPSQPHSVLFLSMCVLLHGFQSTVLAACDMSCVLKDVLQTLVDNGKAPAKTC